MSKTEDLTHLFERLEAFEDRMGVKIEALYAYFHEPPLASEVLRLLFVNFDLHACEGSLLKEDTAVMVTVYDGAGRLIGEHSSTFLKAKFFGFASESILVKVCPGEISKIRVMPKCSRSFGSRIRI